MKRVVRGFSILLASLFVLAGGAAGRLGLGVARAAEPVTFRIGTAIPDYAYAFFTERPDILKHYGKSYKIEWVKFTGSGGALSAFAAKKVDLSIMTILPLINAATKYRLDFKVIHSQQDHGVDGHFATTFMARADSGVRRIEDLKGKIAGVNVRGGVLDLALRIMLMKHGLKPDSDVTIVEGQFPHLGAMIRDKKIDLGSIIQPFYSREQKKGGLIDVFTTVDAFETAQPLSFRAAHGSVLKEHAAAVRDYVDDYLRTIAWGHDHREEAVRAYSKTWKIPEETLMDYFLTKKDTLYRRDGVVDVPLLQKVVETLVRTGFLKESVDVSKYVDLSFLPAKR